MTGVRDDVDEYAPREPRVGDRILFASATASGVSYPGVVLRTRRSTDPATLARWNPRPDGTVPERPAGFVPELPDEFTVDVLVWGLTSDYREFAVAFSATAEPRSWRHV